MIEVFRALGNRNRLRIVCILERGPLNVSEITSVLMLQQSNASRHLRRLLEAGVVKRHGSHGWSYYMLSDENPNVAEIIELARGEVEDRDWFKRDSKRLAKCFLERKESSRRFFDQKASRWDRLGRMLPDAESYLEDVMAELPSDGDLVEIGCGTGKLMVRLSGSCGRIIGVDQSAEMLSRAAKRVIEAGISKRAELRLGDAEHIPVGDGRADGVLMNMVLHHVPEPAEVLFECARILRSGGILILAELTEHQNSDFQQQQGDLWPGFKKQTLESWLAGAGFDEKRSGTINSGKGFWIAVTRRERA
ncbi:metalloregulator ArsR/SmtB family transcription factor [Candidatus Fermentibacteria bacterium]|nr:metalloregulator ArsR/SmtB family transcription factor [Candidatus Fermentibacteria bacterium]